MLNAKWEFTATDYNWMYLAAVRICNGARCIFYVGVEKGKALVMTLYQ